MNASFFVISKGTWARVRRSSVAAVAGARGELRIGIFGGWRFGARFCRILQPARGILFVSKKFL